MFNTIIADTAQNNNKEFDKKFPWWELKKQNMRLARILDVWSRSSKKRYNINPQLPSRVALCSSGLQFKRYINGNLRLIRGMFCKHKLCPICNKRKSRLLSYQCSQMVEHITRQYGTNDYTFLYLTLTVKNLPIDISPLSLKIDLDRMESAFKRIFAKGKGKIAMAERLQKNVLGYVKAFEMTVSKEQGYHPHYHVLLMVKNDYFQHDNYCTLDYYIELWRKALNINYNPNVDIRALKLSSSKAIMDNAKELLKYSTKLNNVLDLRKDNTFVTDDEITIVETLIRALHGKRMISFSGIFKDVRKELKQEDIEKANLLSIGDDVAEDVEEVGTVTYQFDFKTGVYVEFIDDITE